MSKRKGSGSKRRGGQSLIASSTSFTNSGGTKLSASNELSKLGLQSVSQPRGIHFGTAPTSRQTSGSTGGGLFSDLLKSGTTGTAKSLLSGGVLGLLGGSLFSGIASLFGGGGDTPAPLVQFSLPDTQSRTIDVMGSTQNRGTQLSTSSSIQANQLYSNRNNDIVRAVKQALLTSSELSDVISEI